MSLYITKTENYIEKHDNDVPTKFNSYIRTYYGREVYQLDHRTHQIQFEPVREKTGLRGFRPGLTQTDLYSRRSRLEAWNFGFKKKRNCTIRVLRS